MLKLFYLYFVTESIVTAALTSGRFGELLPMLTNRNQAPNPIPFEAPDPLGTRGMTHDESHVTLKGDGGEECGEPAPMWFKITG